MLVTDLPSWLAAAVPIPSAHYEFGDDDSISDPAISEMQSAVYPLLVVTSTHVQCVGTAFCVAGDGVLATARHVVDDADRLIRLAREAGDHQVGLAVMWYGNTTDGTADVLGIRVPISDVCRHPDEWFDFALLTAMVPAVNGTRIRFPSLPLDFAMPAVDDFVIMLGYTGFTFETNDDTATITQPLRLSRGHVKDVHFPIRDVTRGAFPCFGTDARCDPGMSGGPALRIAADGSASVIGLNITDYNNPEDPEHASFVAALRTLLPLEVAMVGPDGGCVTRTLLDLGRDDHLVSDTDFSAWHLQMTDHAVAIAVHPDDDGLITYDV